MRPLRRKCDPGVIRRSCVPKHIHVEVTRFATCPRAKKLFQVTQIPLRHLCREGATVITLGPTVTPPDPGFDLVTTDLTRSADSRVVVASLDHAQRIEPGKAGLNVGGTQREQQNEVAHKEGYCGVLDPPNPNLTSRPATEWLWPVERVMSVPSGRAPGNPFFKVLKSGETRAPGLPPSP